MPGPESFAQEPRTPAELWAAVDYLLRTGQTGKAIPYLDRFMGSNPDDATLIDIRDRYGAGSILRLADDPATAGDPLLALVPAERRATLLAQPAASDGAGVYRFDIVLQGAGETVFFNF